MLALIVLGMGLYILRLSKSVSPSKECAVGGCNTITCYDKSQGPPITTCELLPWYVCYKYARCEVQEDGECGWTKTEKFKQCWQEKGGR